MPVTPEIETKRIASEFPKLFFEQLEESGFIADKCSCTIERNIDDIFDAEYETAKMEIVMRRMLN